MGNIGNTITGRTKNIEASNIPKSRDGVMCIVDERFRQKEILGYTDDSEYTNNELLKAAISYIYACGEDKVSMDAAVEIWPWEYPFKPGSRIRNLEKAGALIAAEIDRHVASQQN